jgi:hypothetical protein
MTIEIHEPELEALIRKRMETGAFQSVEDVLVYALKAAPENLPARPKQSLAQFLLDSPLAGSGLVA